MTNNPMHNVQSHTLFRPWLLSLLLAVCLNTAWAQKRVALVIGNSTYKVESRLANPVNDAQLIARTLKAQGFTVDVKTDLPKREMELAIASFVRQSAGADSAVLYYAGHGAQPANGGRNFLLPIDAKVEGDDTLETDGIAADRIVDQMERSANPAKIRLVVLDACRNNRLAGKTRSGVRGLARMTPSDDYTLIAFSTNDQEVALDGTGANSPYAQALSKHLGKANELPLRRIFELTATDVRAATNQKQKPRTYGDLDSRMLLNGSQVASISPEPVLGPNLLQVEQQAWNAAQRANSIAAYDAYLAGYPSGSFVAAARVALAGLQPTMRVETAQAAVQVAPTFHEVIVARVNGKAVPMSRIDALTQQVVRSGRSITPEVKGQIKDEVIAREVFIQEAQKQGLDTTEEFHTQMELARQTITIRELFAKFEKSNPIENQPQRQKKLADYQQQLRSNAKVTISSDSPNIDTLAFVNDRAVPRSRMEALTQQVVRAGKPLTPEVRTQIKDDVIAREIFIQEAQKQGLDTTEDFRTQMELARQTILIRELFVNFEKNNHVEDKVLKDKKLAAYQEQLRVNAEIH